jgi:hypothetical protein
MIIRHRLSVTHDRLAAGGIMKKIRGIKFHLSVTIALYLSLSCLPGTATAKDPLKGLYDKPFTDPSQRTEMPAEWVKKKITYERESENADVTIVLDQDIYHTILPIIQKYGREHNLRIAVKEGTCGIAAGMLSRKEIDIGGFCCPTGKEDRLPGLRHHTLGIVAKALLVHQDNPVDTISVEQARDIFRGKIFRWSEIKTDKGQPGPNWTIRAIGRFHCKARPGHWHLLLPDEKMFSPLLHEVGSIPDMIAQVGSSREAIGWEVLSMTEHYKSLGRVKALKINGYMPTDKNALATKKYPLYRVYNLSTWEGKNTANPNAQKLVEYIMRETEHLDSKFGFVPASRLKKSGWRFKDMELIGEPK